VLAVRGCARGRSHDNSVSWRESWGRGNCVEELGHERYKDVLCEHLCIIGCCFCVQPSRSRWTPLVDGTDVRVLLRGTEIISRPIAIGGLARERSMGHTGPIFGFVFRCRLERPHITRLHRHSVLVSHATAHQQLTSQHLASKTHLSHTRSDKSSTQSTSPSTSYVD